MKIKSVNDTLERSVVSTMIDDDKTLSFPMFLAIIYPLAVEGDASMIRIATRS